MTLKLSKNQELTDIVSEDSSNPVTTTHLAAGSTQQVKLFLYNDDASRTYSNVSVAPFTLGQVQVAPDVAGAPGTYADTLPLTVAGPNTAVPFWMKVTTPALTETKTDLRLVTNGDWTTL
jgi:hypothetical protein